MKNMSIDTCEVLLGQRYERVTVMILLKLIRWTVY